MSGPVDAETLRRAARCLCDAEARRRALDEAAGRVDALLRGFATVAAGEQAFVQELRKVLEDEVFAGFERLRGGATDAAGGAASGERLERIERALEDPRWALLAEVRDHLEEKRAAQEAEATRLNDALGAHREALKQLAKRLGDARRERAATVRDDRWLAALDARLKRAERSQTDKDLVAAAVEAVGLEAEFSTLVARRDEIERKVGGAQQIRKRADLLVLQSPLDSFQRRQYEAMLRTASEPGVHGINLHEASTVVQQDRDELSERVRRISDEIRAGRLRSVSATLGAANGPAAPPADGTSPPQRDAIPAWAPAPAASISGVPALRDAGSFMYRLLVPESVQRYLGGSACSLTITTNDLELPWELMHDDEEFLCLKRPVARMPMGTFLPPEGRAGKTEEVIRFLLVAPDEGLRGAQDEVAAIAGALRRDWGSLAEVDVLGPDSATGRELNERLRSGRYDVVHYAGHASFNSQNADLSGLVLKGGELFLAQKARRLLGGRPLVFLNACESGATSNEAAPDPLPRAGYLQKPAGGLASSFIYGGALGCVGSLWPVYDDAAARLAIDFYESLLDGTMIGEAMRAARVENRRQFPAQVTWAGFVLYGDPTFQLRER